MGLFGRIKKLLQSNLTALVDRAEDPAKMLDQAIEDMKKGKIEAQKSLIEARTEQRILEKRRDRSREEAADLERKALTALRAGDESFARKFLEQKARVDARLSSEENALGEQAQQIEQLEAAQQALEQRLLDMPARRATLVARQATAEAKGARGAGGRGSEVASALEAFERMEQKIMRAEVEAEVLSESRPQLESLAPAKVVQRYSADEALAALKEQMHAQLSPGKKQIADAGGDVEDTLRAMKDQLNKAGSK